MMNRAEFFEYVKENVKDYLPPALEKAKITVKEHKKEDFIFWQSNFQKMVILSLSVWKDFTNIIRKEKIWRLV